MAFSRIAIFTLIFNMNSPGIDFIGDIHGHADELKKLLKKMGYVRRGAAIPKG